MGSSKQNCDSGCCNLFSGAVDPHWLHGMSGAWTHSPLSLGAQHNTVNGNIWYDILIHRCSIQWNILPSKNGSILCWCSTEVAAHLLIITCLKKAEFGFASRAAVASAQSEAGSPWRAAWCDSLGVQHPPHCTYRWKQIPAVQRPTAEGKSISRLPSPLSCTGFFERLFNYIL